MNCSGGERSTGGTKGSLRQAHHLDPPFSKDNTIHLPYSSISFDSLLPPIFRHDDRLCDPRRDVQTFLHSDLRTPKLNKIHRYLWLAGLPRPARSLHRQRLLGRVIYITEIPDEHLLWHETSVFIKPLPEYLLSYEIWKDKICQSEELHRSACGLLLSYAWLVSSRIDFNIACEIGLIPPEVKWDSWAVFIRDIVNCFDVDSRYEYGELRLSRLNSLYRLGIAGFSLRNLVYGYMSGSQRYTTFFQRNFGWILAVFVYVTVVLSALQVSLATERFGRDSRFQGFSSGVALVALGFVLTAVGAALAVWLALFGFHLVSTIQYCKKVDSQKQHTV
ncbi:uncharacterized protein CTRU02_206887 [Colletotrichum truncatum]|uniref:Uncharacterized protein n=1 Tax=Colletotrichum truncatum TaxID=5467 RepID=A0ACC3YYW4_COLTU|nr:uncharacterized protein CTRU02_15382 [Colletotrichum truncatum]KAF6781102.1 hypothetical protein CTRU02_15382 [Colletotrichum truncatum]